MVHRVMHVIRRSLPAVFMSCVYMFLYIPIAVLVIFSFNNAHFPAPWRGFTLHWYRELYNAPQMWDALSNSLIVAAISTLITIMLSMLLLLYTLLGGRIERWLSGFYINLVIPEIILAVGLLSLFMMLSVTPGLATLIIAHTVLGFGYVLPVVYQRYQEIDTNIIEASLDLGASISQTFYRVIIPMLTPALVTAAILAFVVSLDDFVLAYFCAGASAQTLPLYLLAMLRTGVSPVVNALSTLVLAVSSLLVAIYAYMNMKRYV